MQYYELEMGICGCNCEKSGFTAVETISSGNAFKCKTW